MDKGQENQTTIISHSLRCLMIDSGRVIALGKSNTGALKLKVIVISTSTFPRQWSEEI